MLKKIAITWLACFPLYAWSYDFELSIGGGHQYGGLLGAQLGMKNDKRKYYLSLGSVGAAIGMQATFPNNEKHSIGFSIGKLKMIHAAETQYGFVTYNYHFKDFKQNGWTLGTGIGYFRRDKYEDGLFQNTVKKWDAKPGVTFDAGYKF